MLLLGLTKLWSSPFVNAICVAQTSQMSCVLLSFWVLSVPFFSVDMGSYMATKRNSYRSASIHASSEATFQYLHFYSNEMVTF